MSFHTIKTYSVTDHAETLKDLIASKQLRVDNNRGTSATEPQVVYGPIGQLVVKEVEEAPAPIKVGDVYKTKAGGICRIIATDRKGFLPVVGLLSYNSSSVEVTVYYSPNGTHDPVLPSSAETDLVLPSTRRKIVEFSATAQWSPEDYPGF